MKIGVQYVVG
ncbi:unnamed protein product [Linum tenue]|uniref:Uncharacterized protein n=1 Tax=Linum tenue TaxID=586396 RepID=A0AAV0PXL0_9ROSI|nr:unnamed protein product [Linum tenue]